MLYYIIMNNKKHKKKYNNISETNYYIILGCLLLGALIIIIDNIFKKPDMPVQASIPASVPVSALASTFPNSSASASPSGLEAKKDSGTVKGSNNGTNIVRKDGYQIYFEKQDSGFSCGRQAVNNLIGRKFYDKTDNREITQDIFTNNNNPDNNNSNRAINLKSVCKYIQEEIKKAVKYIDDFECTDNENYSFHVLLFALNMAGYKKKNENTEYTYKKDTVKSDLNAEYYEGCSMLVNKNKNHWIAIEFINNKYYYKDGLENDIIVSNNYSDHIDVLVKNKFHQLWAVKHFDEIPQLKNQIKLITDELPHNERMIQKIANEIIKFFSF
jgi:hypothetical protein